MAQRRATPAPSSRNRQLQNPQHLFTVSLAVYLSLCVSTIYFSPSFYFGAFTTLSHDPLIICIVFALLAGITTFYLVPRVSGLFVRAGITGKDVHKTDKPLVPESMGTLAGLVYIVTMFLFIPVPFITYFHISKSGYANANAELASTFPFDKLGTFLSALLSLISMIFLGFADDVLNLKWRHKLFLPTIASLPLLMVYHVSHGVTWVIVPKPLRFLLGGMVDLGPLYYIYMSMLSVFCTNSINILAGVNGVEIGQSLVIALSILVNDFLYLNGPDYSRETHLLSMFFLFPFVGVSLGLAKWNFYPSRVFVGDTYCYFAGMTFAVVGILGHFSKTVLLFFIPQIFNFVFSIPQLFRLVPCPRHRMPNYDTKTDLLHASYFELPPNPSTRTRAIITVFKFFRLIDIKNNQVSNFTILNLLLVKFGPMREGTLTNVVVVIQILCSLLAFGIRYGVAGLVFDVVQ